MKTTNIAALCKTREPESAHFSPDVVTADWLKKSEQSPLRRILGKGVQPELISFALGLPASELLPRQSLSEAFGKVLKDDGESIQLGPPFQPLKEKIVELMSNRGVHCRPEQVFLISGAQQGLSLIARLLLNEGSEVMIEKATYPGLHMAIAPLRPKVIMISSDRDGINTEEIEELLASGARPAFIFTMSDGHNPLGINMSPRRRERLVEIARRYRVPVIEDDVYGFLNYEGPLNPPMRALDDRWVLYLGSFSKLLGPGLRTGWMIVPEALISPLSIIKDLSDIDSCTLTQRAITSYLTQTDLLGQLNHVRNEYRERRDSMLRALEQHFSGTATWVKPVSGIFIWLCLAKGVDTAELLKVALEQEQVSFVPGKAFVADGGDLANECLRLNFTYCPRERIREGIARLARAHVAFSA